MKIENLISRVVINIQTKKCGSIDITKSTKDHFMIVEYPDEAWYPSQVTVLTLGQACRYFALYKNNNIDVVDHILSDDVLTFDIDTIKIDDRLTIDPDFNGVCICKSTDGVFLKHAYIENQKFFDIDSLEEITDVSQYRIIAIFDDFFVVDFDADTVNSNSIYNIIFIDNTIAYKCKVERSKNEVGYTIKSFKDEEIIKTPLKIQKFNAAQK